MIQTPGQYPDVFGRPGSCTRACGRSITSPKDGGSEQTFDVAACEAELYVAVSFQSRVRDSHTNLVPSSEHTRLQTEVVVDRRVGELFQLDLQKTTLCSRCKMNVGP